MKDSIRIADRLAHSLRVIGSLWFALWSSVAAGDGATEFPTFEFSGLLDGRVSMTDAQPGEQERGLGKFRLGGADRLRLNEAAIALRSRLNWDWSMAMTIKHADQQRLPLDWSEAFLAYRPVATSPWTLSGRLGMFFPPISLENIGTVWSSPYTLNSSAINGWVGEELRSFGGELQLGYRFEGGDRIGAFAAGIANNDTAGVLLAWRGWTLTDYEAGLHDRLPLPRDIGLGNAFPRQAAETRPFVEVDGRPGFYLGLNADRAESYTFRAMYYDNRANPTAIEQGQYAWHTRFFSVGLKRELPWQITAIVQGLSGRTRMGAMQNGQFAVDADFWSASALLSKAWGNQRWSVRFERFGSGERDFLPQDRNKEQGQALTAGYNLTLAQRHQFNVEISVVNSNRPARAYLQQVGTQQETQWQFAYRIFF